MTSLPRSLSWPGCYALCYIRHAKGRSDARETEGAVQQSTNKSILSFPFSLAVCALRLFHDISALCHSIITFSTFPTFTCISPFPFRLSTLSQPHFPLGTPFASLLIQHDNKGHKKSVTPSCSPLHKSYLRSKTRSTRSLTTETASALEPALPAKRSRAL